MMQHQIIRVDSKEVQMDFIDNTLDENENIIRSKDVTVLCDRAYATELKIYDVDAATFGLDVFNKAFLGRNKLTTQPESYPALPYSPEDIIVLSNNIMVFSEKNHDIGYFSTLCFCHRENEHISNIHFRFMAGIDLPWRGKRLFYLPVASQMLKALQLFQHRFPEENPMVNMTQFAMVSAGTPGVIGNLAGLLLPDGIPLPPFEFKDAVANNMAVMMGLGSLLLTKGEENQYYGIADINLRIKQKTLSPNIHNAYAKAYSELNVKEGAGLTGRQPLCHLKTLLKKQNTLHEDYQNFLRKKSKPQEGKR